MLDSRRGRAGALVALAAVHVGLMVWYGSLAPAPAAGAYPGNDDLGAEYDRYVGERVEVGGWVVATDPTVIRVPYGSGRTMRLAVRDVPVPVERGEYLRLYGSAEGGRTVRAIDAFTVSRAGHWYAWTVSFVAGLWVLGRIVRGWRFDPGALALEPRATPRRLRTLLSDRISATE